MIRVLPIRAIAIVGLAATSAAAPQWPVLHPARAGAAVMAYEHARADAVRHRDGHTLGHDDFREARRAVADRADAQHGHSAEPCAAGPSLMPGWRITAPPPRLLERR
jgi:hypothetical protein